MGVVWHKSKQLAIIENLLSHYYVPPILLCKKTDNFRKIRRTCVGGKKRLSYIKLLMSSR